MTLVVAAVVMLSLIARTWRVVGGNCGLGTMWLGVVERVGGSVSDSDLLFAC